MTEHGYIPLGKYSSARDDILHFLCTSDWANESFGDVEAPTGYVWRISNFEADTSPANGEFNSILDYWFQDSPEVTDSPALRSELVGHFLITEDSNGFVYVAEFPAVTDLLREFYARQEQFSDWDNQEEV